MGACTLGFFWVGIYLNLCRFPEAGRAVRRPPGGRDGCLVDKPEGTQAFALNAPSGCQWPAKRVTACLAPVLLELVWARLFHVKQVL